MRPFLIIALSAMLLSGCVANWPSHKTGSRWNGQEIPGNPVVYDPGPIGAPSVMGMR